MNSHLFGWRYAALCALVLGLPIAAACSDATGSSEDEQNDARLEILFPTMYSAYDGVHDFRVPAKVEGVKNVKWSADPSDAVDIEKDGDDGVLITVKKAVDVVTIHAKAGSLKSSAKLYITEATPEEWEEGNERYNNGVVWKRGGDWDGGGGGRGDGGGGGKKKGERRVDPNLACTNCHNKGGKGGDVEHTPMQTGGFSDEELIMIFAEGKKPDGVKMRTTTKERWEKMHKWDMEPEEKKGLIVYLRSLEPEPQGEVDFGGRGGGGGKGKGNGKGKRDDDDDRSGPQGDAGSDPQ